MTFGLPVSPKGRDSSGANPIGPAGGDLSGTFPNPLVRSIAGVSPIPITPSKLQFKNTTAAPTIEQAALGDAVAGNPGAPGEPMTVRARPGQNTTDNQAAGAGGTAVLQSGAAGTSSGGGAAGTKGHVQLKVAGTLVSDFAAAGSDFVALGAQPASGGAIRLDGDTYASINCRAVTGQDSPDVAMLRGAGDDSVTIGGAGCRGIYGTVYRPLGLTDRNIVLQMFADSTQPTKDYISLGGPTAGNASGVNRTAGTGFFRVPYGGQSIIKQRNGTDTGDQYLLYTLPGQLYLGDRTEINNLNLEAASHIIVTVPGALSVFFGDNHVNVLTLFGAQNATAGWQWDASHNAISLNQQTTSTASGADTILAAQAATGAAHNGGNLVLRGGASGAAIPGAVFLDVGNTMVLAAGTNGLQLGTVNVAIAAGSTTLSTTIASSYLKLTGNLAGDATLVFPAIDGTLWIVDASAVVFNAHKVTLRANATNWATPITSSGLWAVFYNSPTGELWGWSLSTSALPLAGASDGDMLLFTGGVWTRLAHGSGGQVLTVNPGDGTTPEWDNSRAVLGEAQGTDTVGGAATPTYTFAQTFTQQSSSSLVIVDAMVSVAPQLVTDAVLVKLQRDGVDMGLARQRGKGTLVPFHVRALDAATDGALHTYTVVVTNQAGNSVTIAANDATITVVEMTA